MIKRQMWMGNTVPTGRLNPYPGYKDSGVKQLGEIPTRWETMPIKRVCRLAYGDSLASTERLEGPVEVYGSNGPVGTHGRANTKAPCLIVGRKGSFGKVNYSDKPVFAIDTTFLVDSRHTSSDMRWLYYVLRHAELDGASKDSAVPGLDREDAYRRDVAVCHLMEQRAIAAFLDRETAKIDVLVAKKERLIELLQEKRAAIITQAVIKGLDPEVPMKDSGVEWPAKIPAHWQLNRAKRVSTFVTSGSRGWATYYTDDGPLFLRIGNLRSGYIDLDLDYVQHVSPPRGTEGERTRVQPGDVLISITALIGAVAVVTDDVSEAYVNQHLALLRPMANEIESRWLAYSLASIVGQSQFQEALYGGTKDGLGLEDIRSLSILSPPLGEQGTIVAFLDRETSKIDTLISKVHTAIDRLKELRTALISAAVTGKIDVRDEAHPAPEATP